MLRFFEDSFKSIGWNNQKNLNSWNEEWLWFLSVALLDRSGMRTIFIRINTAFLQIQFAKLNDWNESLRVILVRDEIDFDSRFLSK